MISGKFGLIIGNKFAYVYVELDTITILLRSSGMWEHVVWEIETLPDYKV